MIHTYGKMQTLHFLKLLFRMVLNSTDGSDKSNFTSSKTNVLKL